LLFQISEEEEGNLSIRCPLCHSKFSLKDGAVMEYCPKDGPLSWIVGTLKDKTSPATAKVCAFVYYNTSESLVTISSSYV
jgi:hypothetical protein